MIEWVIFQPILMNYLLGVVVVAVGNALALPHAHSTATDARWIGRARQRLGEPQSGGLNALSRETLSYAADFLDRPTDEIRCLGVALDFAFLGAGLLARCWMAAIMAKASMTSET